MNQISDAELARYHKMEETIKWVLSQQADDVCWRDIYEKFGSLTGGKHHPQLICDKEKHLANCEKFIDSLRSGPYVPLWVGHSDALVKACQAALEHCTELREAWERGCLDETDGLGGTRSNRNVDVQVMLRDVLSPEICSYCGGKHWRPDCPEIAKEVLRGRAGAMQKCREMKSDTLSK